MDPLDVYFRDLRGLPVPAPGETEALALATVRGDPAARARLIALTLRLVPVVARAFRGYGLDFEDLLGAGHLGLILAADTFDPAAGRLFTTWADRRIRWQIIEALRQPPRSDMLERAGRMRGVSTGPAADVSDDDAAAADDVPLAMAHVAHVADPHEGPAAVAEAAEVAAATAAALRTLRRRLGRLDGRQRAVVTLRFGLGGADPLTLREAGRRLGLGRERVRQLEGLALRALILTDPAAPPPRLPRRRRRARAPAAPPPEAQTG